MSYKLLFNEVFGLLADQAVTWSFSLDSKESEEKGWIVHSSADSSVEDKRFAAVLVYKMLNTAGIKIRDEKAEIEKKGFTNQLNIDYWANKKVHFNSDWIESHLEENRVAFR